MNEYASIVMSWFLGYDRNIMYSRMYGWCLKYAPYNIFIFNQLCRYYQLEIVEWAKEFIALGSTFEITDIDRLGPVSDPFSDPIYASHLSLYSPEGSNRF